MRFTHIILMLLHPFTGDQDLGDVYKVIARSENTDVTYTYTDGSTNITNMFNLAQPGSSNDIMLGFGSPMSISVSSLSLFVCKQRIYVPRL